MGKGGQITFDDTSVQNRIGLVNGLMFIPYPKEKKPRTVPLRQEDVDLYGGTRQGLAGALRQYRTSEEIKRATGHSTNR